MNTVIQNNDHISSLSPLTMPSTFVDFIVTSTPLPATPSPSPYSPNRTRRLILNPPTLKKKQYCSSSSFLPIKTNTNTNLLPYLDFGEDNNDEDANQITHRSSRNNNRNSLVFPSLPRITLKKRSSTFYSRSNTCESSSHYLLSLSSSSREEEKETEEEEEVTQYQVDCEIEELTSPMRRQTISSTAPSSFTTITTTTDNYIVDNDVSFKPIGIKKMTTKMNMNMKKSNSSSMMAARSLSRQLSLTLMNNNDSDATDAAAVGCGGNGNTTTENCHSSSSLSLSSLSQYDNNNDILPKRTTAKKSSLIHKIDFVINNVIETSS